MRRRRIFLAVAAASVSLHLVGEWRDESSDLKRRVDSKRRDFRVVLSSSPATPLRRDIAP